MKSLCIYVIYDKNCIIDKCNEKILKELKKIILDIIVVCNFKKISSGEEYIKPYAKEIYYRDNIGFDSGAYKDIILKLIQENKLSKYNELLLTNDTYFAPIYPFNKMFHTMNEKTCDFWGITRHPKGKNQTGFFDSHIQSYFLYFKQKVLHSDCFKTFWKDMEYPLNYTDAINKFELAINKILLQNGFEGMAYMDLFDYEYKEEFGINPYLIFPLELVRDMNIPILKKKCLEISNPGYTNAIQALEYIDKYTDYDVNCIMDNIYRIHSGVSANLSYDYNELEAFYKKFNHIYIYGHGVWGKNLAEYFIYRKWKFDGFLVSDNTNDAECISVSGYESQKDGGIIIAMGNRKIVDEIYCNLCQICNKEQILKPR